MGIGAYHLINYTASLTYGSASNLLLSGAPVGTRQTYTLSAASNYVDLTVAGTAPASLAWAGGSNFNAWDINSTVNWTGADGKFYNADQVTFTAGSNSPAINITSTVLPGSVTVNSTQNYTFSGVGKISGGTGLTKNGAGTLTLATTNDYSGQTTVSAGTLLVTGGIGDNSPVLINGGTLQAGSNIALGTTNANGTTITSGTLDINAQNLQTEPITVQGVGVGSNGAIVNTGAAQTNALTQITLSGNTTFGGSGEWDIRGTSATLSTGGSSYNLTKTGANTVQLVSVAVDTALGDININQGILKFQDSTTFGDPSKTVTIAAPGTLQFLASTNSMAKHIVSNGGTISASSTNTISQDVVSGTVTVNSTTTVNAANAAGILSFTNLISGNGGLDKTGPGTVIITGMPAYNGNTAIDGGILQINTVGSPVMHNVTGTATLGVGDGTSATNLTVDSISAGTLTISAGSTVTIAAIPGGPLAGMVSISPIPEPATWAMLMLAALGLGIYRRRTR